MKVLRFTAILSVVLLLSGCLKDIFPPNRQVSAEPADQLYSAGEASLASGDYANTVKNFEALESQYPFGRYSEQVQMDLIYAYYKNGDNASAAAAASRYIHLYPRAKHVDYAYYMRGLANFTQNRGLLSRYVNLDLSQRDISALQDSYKDFEDLLHRFPSSRYVADARQRMIYIRNLFAQKELNAAKFYFQRGMYVASANRASTIIQNYSQSPQTEEALKILVKSNRHLALHQSAADALQVLQHNYASAPSIAMAKKM